MDFRCLLTMLFVTTQSDVVLLVCMGIGGYVGPISLGRGVPGLFHDS